MSNMNILRALERTGVSVCQARCLFPSAQDAWAECPRLGGLTHTCLFPSLWRLGSPRSRSQQIWRGGLVRASSCFPYGPLHPVPSCGGKTAGKLSGVSFVRVIIPFARALLPWSDQLPKALTPYTIPLGLRFRHMNVGGTQTFNS